MLSTVVTYATGGVFEGAACRYLLNFDTTADRLTAIGANVFDLPDFLTDGNTEDWLNGCQQNQSLYTVLDPENNPNIDFNLTALMDFSRLSLDKVAGHAEDGC